MALRCKDVFSESSNKESAVIAAAWECRGVVGESEEAYSRPRESLSLPHIIQLDSGGLIWTPVDWVPSQISC